MTGEQGGHEASQTWEAGAGMAPGGPAPGLVGMKGRLRFDVGDKTFGVLVVEDGHAHLETGAAGGPAADALVLMTSPDDVRQLLRGEANPVTLALLGREQLQGNLVFGVKVLLGLREGSPFKNAQQGG